MNLWIRSQNRQKLMKVCNIVWQDCAIVDGNKVDANFLIGVNNYDNDVLGTYESKERALEVLDEIQKILQPQLDIITSNIEQRELTDNHFIQTKIIPNFIEDIKFQYTKTYVYEMPKE